MELLTTKELCDRLKISRWALRRMMDNRLLTQPKHFIDISDSQSPKRVYRWKIDAIIKEFETPARYRRSTK